MILCARIQFRAFLHGLLKEPIISPLKFKMANGRHIENRFWRYFFLFSYCIFSASVSGGFRIISDTLVIVICCQYCV